MLTKTLLRFKRDGDNFLPGYLLPDGNWEEDARQLIELYRESSGWSVEELENAKQEIITPSSRGKILKGLCSILDKRLTLKEVDYETYRERRMQLFRLSGDLLLSKTKISFKEYRTRLDIPDELYGDLPSRRMILSFSEPELRELGERYNMELVQALLVGAEQMLIRLTEWNPKQLRGLLRCLRFFGLVYDSKIIGKKTRETLELRVEGPLSRHGAAGKYAMQTAAIAGVMPQFDNYQIVARVSPGKRRHRGWLKIDSSAPLRSTFPPIDGYLPEEFILFFNEASRELDKLGWKPFKAPLPQSPPSQWQLPDFAWERENGDRVYLEVFLAKQRNNLQARMNIDPPKGQVWILAADRKALPVHRNKGYLYLPFSGMPSGGMLSRLIQKEFPQEI